MCATETPKENFQETDTENCLSLHEKAELGFIFSAQSLERMRAVKLLLEENRDPAESRLIPHSVHGIIYYAGRCVFNPC